MLFPLVSHRFKTIAPLYTITYFLSTDQFRPHTGTNEFRLKFFHQTACVQWLRPTWARYHRSFFYRLSAFRSLSLIGCRLQAAALRLSLHFKVSDSQAKKLLIALRKEPGMLPTIFSIFEDCHGPMHGLAQYFLGSVTVYAKRAWLETRSATMLLPVSGGRTRTRFWSYRW